LVLSVTQEIRDVYTQSFSVPDDEGKAAGPKTVERPASEREAALLQLEDDFYKVLSGGTRIAMLIAMVDLGLAQLLMRRGPLTEDEILSGLDLHRGRGHKWVLLLESVGLLVPIRDSAGGTRYDQPALSRALVDPAAPNHFFYRDFLRFWRVASSRDLTSLLHGAKVTDPVRYPPVLWDDVVLLHEWMRDGALATLASIERRFDFGRYRRILDVAGGDAHALGQGRAALPGHGRLRPGADRQGLVRRRECLRRCRPWHRSAAAEGRFG